MKLWELVAALQEVSGFESPDVSLEQYITGPDVAARTLFAINNSFAAIEGNLVADIGCGTGMLGIGCALLGAQHVVGFDIDRNAISQARSNVIAAGLDSNDIDFIRCDVLAPSGLPIACDPRSAAYREGALVARHGPFDVAVMNPPFGTRNPGADVGFVTAGLAAVNPEGCVFSMHKSSTRAHFVRTAERLGVGVEVVAQLRFDLPATYAFHRAGTLDVAVDLLRFAKGEAGRALAARHSTIPPFVASEEGGAAGTFSGGPRGKQKGAGKRGSGGHRR